MPRGVYKRTLEMKTGKYKRTPEMNAANSKAKTGVPLSPEHCATIKKSHEGIPKSPEHIAAIRESDATKANTDKMRGGNDIVKHHHIYDHDDLSKYTIKMARSQHTILHNNMQLLDLKVPHINTVHENEDELKLMKYLKKIESEPKGL